MGNKHSSFLVPQQSREKHIGISTNHDRPTPVSHIDLRCYKSQPSLMKSVSSHETVWSENPAWPPNSYHLDGSPPPSKLTTYTPLTPPISQQDTEARACSAFLKSFPEYQSTWILDTLRRTDFGRLDRAGETYVDYMGGAQHPESLVRIHSSFLNESIMGNTHSVSNRYVISKNLSPTLLI
jgi:molybdenum cofactor sulfurtransferase